MGCVFLCDCDGGLNCCVPRKFVSTHPVSDPASAGDFRICRDRLDPADIAVLLDLKVRGDIVLPDDQALLAKAGEQVKLEQPRSEIDGLQVGDEIGIRLGSAR